MLLLINDKVGDQGSSHCGWEGWGPCMVRSVSHRDTLQIPRYNRGLVDADLCVFFTYFRPRIVCLRDGVILSFGLPDYLLETGVLLLPAAGFLLEI